MKALAQGAATGLDFQVAPGFAPLVPPVTIPAGVSTVRGFLAFQTTVAPWMYDPAKLEDLRFTVVVEDGHGQTYEV